MANRLDNAAKTFQEGICNRCQRPFRKTGPNHKRCDPCKIEHKRQYERENKRARVARRNACDGCGLEFPSHVHARRRRCTECASALHHSQNMTSQRKRLRERYRSDPAFRLQMSVSTLVRRSLRQNKAGRRWESLVGYTVDHLRAHLERQFRKGMTWENYGSVWHVDHIIPRASFTFDSAEHPDFLACWALTNLRPLWAKDNFDKRAKRLHLL